MHARCLQPASISQKLPWGSHPSAHHRRCLARAKASIKEGGFCVPSSFLGPRAAARPPFATAFGLSSTTPRRDRSRTHTIPPQGPGGCCVAPGRCATTQSYLSNSRDSHTLESIMESATQGTRSPSNHAGSPELEPGWWEVPTHHSADLTRTALQHRLRIPFLETMPPCVPVPGIATECDCPCLLRSRPGSSLRLPERESRPAPTPPRH